MLAVSAGAQSPTGTISGRVTDPDGAVIVGAAVSIESPSLQGGQRTVTSANGDYIFKLLPPGRYTLTAEAAGFGQVKTSLTLSATQPVSLDVAMAPATVSERVDVVAEGTTFVGTVQTATNIKASLMQELPTARTVLSAVDLAPAVHSTGP